MTRGVSGSAARMLVALLIAALAAPGCASPARRAARKERREARTTTAPVPTDSGLARASFSGTIEPAQRAGVHIDLARTLESQGRFEDAVAAYQKAIDEGARRGSKAGREQQALAHRRMAAALDRLGRFVQSESHYREALKLAPNDPRAWNDAGYSQYLQGQWAEAERRLKSAAKLAPDDPRILTNLGLARAAAGKVDEALEVLTRAGGEAAAHANVAYVLASTGKAGAARDHYRAVLELEPESPLALAALAKLDAPAAPTTTLAADRPDDAITRAAANRPVELPTAPPARR